MSVYFTLHHEMKLGKFRYTRSETIIHRKVSEWICLTFEWQDQFVKVRSELDHLTVFYCHSCIRTQLMSVDHQNTVGRRRRNTTGVFYFDLDKYAFGLSFRSFISHRMLVTWSYIMIFSIFKVKKQKIRKIIKYKINNWSGKK